MWAWKMEEWGGEMGKMELIMVRDLVEIIIFNTRSELKNG